MIDEILTTSIVSNGITAQNFLICSIVSIALGIISTFIYMYKNSYSKNFVVTLALLPAIVQGVILLVNGNLGTGVAVMGAFSLVRFRSIPGGAREIGSIFLSMAIGLASGMGYIAIAALFVLIIGIANLILLSSNFADQKNSEKDLKIIIPESLDYTEVFDDIFEKYTTKSDLITAKTTNMGSLYELYYQIKLKNIKDEKKFIDDLRCRNGNLNIMCGRLKKKEEL